VNGTTIGELMAAGCRGVAVCAAIAAAPDPREATRTLREAIDASASGQAIADRNRRNYSAERSSGSPPARH
jgi:thiazole synthase ThiGH ThiG subunit